MIPIDASKRLRIFIAYAREDLAFVEQFAAALEAYFEVFYDRHLIAGENFRSELTRRVLWADVGIVVWSKHSVDKHWVNSEASRFQDLQKYVPIRIDEARPPLGLDQNHHVALVGWPAQSHDKFDSLVQSLSRRAGLPSGPTIESPFARVAGSIARQILSHRHRVPATLFFLLNITIGVAIGLLVVKEDWHSADQTFYHVMSKLNETEGLSSVRTQYHELDTINALKKQYEEERATRLLAHIPAVVILIPDWYETSFRTTHLI